MQDFTEKLYFLKLGELNAALPPDLIADLAGIWALRLEALVLVARNTGRPIEEQSESSVLLL